MAFGITADFNKGESEELKPLEQKPVEQVQTPVKEETPPVKPIEDVKPIIENKSVTENKPAVEPVKEAVKGPELNNDMVAKYLKEKYKDHQFENVDDLFKKPEPITKEVEKVVNPYEDVMDDETKAYLEFRKETGRSRKEFEFLSEDISVKSPLELSREKIRQETGLKLNNSEADEYLEKKLGIDLSESDLSINDKIELTSFSKAYKDSLLEQQEKYRKPLDEVLKAKSNQVKEKFVELENGTRMTESQYQQFEANRIQYQEDIKKAVDSVASFDFKIPIDNNGEKSELAVSYELSKEDKHSMLSDALDVDATIRREFQSEEGFNHSELAQTLHRGLPKNFNKIMTAMAKQVRAATIEEMTANNNNENFDVKPMQKVKTGKEGYGELPTGETRPRTFGVKASRF